MSEQEAVKPCDMFSPVIGMCGLPMGHEGDHAKAIEAPKTPLSASEIRELPPKASLMINSDEPKVPLQMMRIPVPESKVVQYVSTAEILGYLRDSRHLHIAVSEACHYYVNQGSAEDLDKAVKLIGYLKQLCAETAGRAK